MNKPMATMKTEPKVKHGWKLIILVALVLVAHTMDYNDTIERISTENAVTHGQKG